MFSRVATDVSSEVKSTSQSVSFNMSNSATVPHRRISSSLSAVRFLGSSRTGSFGTLIHDSPFRTPIFTPPQVASTSAWSSRSRPTVIFDFRSARNSAGSCGCLNAA